MSKYINEICVGCGLPIKEDDDIVVCPECATPQHRECYNKENACVNSHRHSENFVWQAQNVSEEVNENDKAPCPVCGFENKKNSDVCHRCGQILESKSELFEEKGQSSSNLFGGVFPSEDELLSESDRSQIESVLNERARIAAPGMTQEQEKEIVAGHPIKKVMTLIANKALVYVNKFRAIEHGKKFTWNWAAFLFSPFWFFYRRMYKTGIIFLTIRTCISIILTGPMMNIASIYSSLDMDSLASMSDEAYRELLQTLLPNMTPIYIGGAAMLVLAVISGIIGDRFYRRKVRSILDEAERSRTRDEYLIKLLKGSAVNPIAVALAYAVSVFLPNIISSFFM